MIEVCKPHNNSNPNQSAMRIGMLERAYGFVQGEKMLCSAGLILIRRCVVSFFIVIALLFTGCAHSQRMETRTYFMDRQFWMAVGADREFNERILSQILRKLANDDSEDDSEDDYVLEYNDEAYANTLREFLEFEGLLPEGSFLVLKHSENKLILHNFPNLLDKIEELLAEPRGRGSFFKRVPQLGERINRAGREVRP